MIRGQLEAAGWRTFSEYDGRWWIRPGDPDRLYDFPEAVAMLRSWAAALKSVGQASE
jgi:hypothetical protein